MLHSFRARLTLAYSLTFSVLLLLFCGMVYYVHGRHLQLAGLAPEHVAEMQRQLLEPLLLIGLLALALIAGSGWLLATLTVRPIERIAAAAREISERDLARRIPAMPAVAELGRLIDVLNQTFGRLAAAVDSQRRFVADASHEFLSPLTNHRAELEVALRRDRSPEEYRQVLRSSIEEVDRLTRLADDLLLLSSGDQGRLPLLGESVALDPLVAETAERFGRRATAKGLTLATDLSLDGCAVRADRDRLRQVLDNLVENAIRYTPAGKRVCLRTRRNGQSAQLQVVDEGIGIPQEEQAAVFERFYRADKARSRAEGGSGLGLSICRLLVEQAGGSIALESQAGLGSTFTVSLPLDAPAG